MKTSKLIDGGFEFETYDVTKCMVCRSELDYDLGIIVESSLDAKTAYSIIPCSYCGLGHSQPRPTEESIGQLYESKNQDQSMLSRRDFDPDKSRIFSALKYIVTKRQISKFFKNLNVLRVVDFGTGNGRYANQINTLLGVNVCAVDYQNLRPAKLRDAVEYLTSNQFFAQNETYDVIFLRHVLEHSHDPIRLLQLLALKLGNNGRIILEVPNFDSTFRRIFKKSWVGNYLPRHLHHFTTRSLELALREAGLSGSIEMAEMPLMGNQIARLFRAKNYSLPFKIMGVIFHPLQILVEKTNRSSTVIRAMVTAQR